MPNIDQISLTNESSATVAVDEDSAELAPTSHAEAEASGSVFVFGDVGGLRAGETETLKSPSIPAGCSGVSAIERAEREDRLRRSTRVLTRADLERLLVLLPERLGLKAQERHGGRICAGLLGFPNVGKSSVINTLMSASRATHGTSVCFYTTSFLHALASNSLCAMLQA